MADIEYKTPQDVADEKASKKAGELYDKSLTNTPLAPKMPAPKMPEPKKKMAKGGSASSRADGIAQRGKTRGMIVACGGGKM